MNSGSVRAESNTLPQPQNKQDILWTVAHQTLWKHWRPGTQLMPLEMTCLPSVWLLVLISADEDGCNQGSSPWWAAGDIKPETILHNLMVSTVQFLALKKAKAEKFLDVVSYRVVSKVSHELDRTEMLLWASNGPEQRHFFATYTAIGEQMHTTVKNQSLLFTAVNSYIIWMYFMTKASLVGIWLYGALTPSRVHTLRNAVYLQWPSCGITSCLVLPQSLQQRLMPGSADQAVQQSLINLGILMVTAVLWAYLS